MVSSSRRYLPWRNALNVVGATNQWRLIDMGYWIVEAKKGALRGVRSDLPGDRLSLPAVVLQLKILGSPTEISPAQPRRDPPTPQGDQKKVGSDARARA
jgi:hypothetical protein